MLPTEAAYVAGIVDGEGCFVLSRVGDRFNVSLEVSNTDRRLLEVCQAFTGIGAIYDRPRSGKLNHRPQFMWSSGSRADLAAVIPQIMPYLVGKRAEGAAVADYCRRRVAAIPLDSHDDALSLTVKRRIA